MYHLKDMSAESRREQAQNSVISYDTYTSFSSLTFVVDWRSKLLFAEY